MQKLTLYKESLVDLPYTYGGKIVMRSKQGLVILDLTTGTQQLFVGLSNIHEPRWSLDGQKIAFGRNQIFMFDVNSYEVKNVAPDLSGIGFRHVCWTSNGKGLIVTRNKPKSSGLYLLDIETLSATQIPSGIEAHNADCSPDGKKLAFLYNPWAKSAARLKRGGDFRIFMIDMDCLLEPDCPKFPLTNSKSGRPAWSPDSKTIVYARFNENRAGITAVYTVSIESGETNQLSPYYRHLLNPIWSPDGQHISFSKDTPNGIPSLHIMRSDGTDVTEILEGGLECDWWGQKENEEGDNN